MEEKNTILGAPDAIKEICGFRCDWNKIVLLFPKRDCELIWIESYKKHHKIYRDIIEWSRDHGIVFQELQGRQAKQYLKFVKMRKQV